MNPLISVMIGAYNAAPYLGEAIESVFAQDYEPIELIVVDDGSTDRTAEIVESFADPRLRLIRGARRGTSATTNDGLRLSRAPLVARLDADDVMEPNRLERQVAFLTERPHLGGAASHYWLIDENGVVRGAHTPRLETMRDVELQLRYGGRLTYPHPTVMYRRQVVLGLGGYDSRFDRTEDVDMLLRMHEAGWPILMQPEKLTRFRVHGASVSALNARTQHFHNETIFGNYQRRRRGEADLPIEHYVALSRANLLRRLVTEGRILASRLKRARTIALMRRRPVLSAAISVAAILLDLRGAAGALLRRLHRWRSMASLPALSKSEAAPAIDAARGGAGSRRHARAVP